MNKDNKSKGELGNFLQQILIVFVILKLVPGTDIYYWSWWWVLAPFWVPFLIAMLLILYYIIMNFGRKD